MQLRCSNITSDCCEGTSRAREGVELEVSLEVESQGQNAVPPWPVLNLAEIWSVFDGADGAVGMVDFLRLCTLPRKHGLGLFLRCLVDVVNLAEKVDLLGKQSCLRLAVGVFRLLTR